MQLFVHLTYSLVVFVTDWPFLASLKFDMKLLKWGEISCLFLPEFGSIGASYILQLLFVNPGIAYNSATTEAIEKISTDLEWLEF